MTADVENRRRYFRLDDRVRLSYIKRARSETIAARRTNRVVHPAAEKLEQIDHELNKLLNTLWRDNPLAAQVLVLLNRKIQILGTEVDLDPCPPDLAETREAEVNLSACGIAFNCPEEFEEGDVLEMQITLLPAYVSLRLMARVTAFEPNQNGIPTPHRVRTEFLGQQDEAHETLVQHLVQRQSELIASRNEDEE